MEERCTTEILCARRLKKLEGTLTSTRAHKHYA